MFTTASYHARFAVGSPGCGLVRDELTMTRPGTEAKAPPVTGRSSRCGQPISNSCATPGATVWGSEPM